MRLRSQHEPSQSEVRDDTLARLLASEERSAARLASARTEAETILREARDEAQRTEDACAATIELRLAALVTEHESRLASDLEAIRREAVDVTSRFDVADAERTRQHVAFIIGRLLPSEPPPPETSR